MGKTIRFFNYPAALAHYERLISNMRQGSVGHDGIRKIAKPILILSVIKGIRLGRFKTNKFTYDELNKLYKPLFSKHFISGRQDNLTPLRYPFYYLQSDDFWHLSWLNGEATTTASPSDGWMRRNVSYAYIDDELWILLQNDKYAEQLQEFVVKKKISPKQQSCDMAAETLRKRGIKAFLSALMII